MFTALILVCSINSLDLCFVRVSTVLFPSYNECIADINASYKHYKFRETVNTVTFDMKSYKCISWEDKSV